MSLIKKTLLHHSGGDRPKMPRIPSSFSTDLHQCMFPNASIPAIPSFLLLLNTSLLPMPLSLLRSPVAKPVHYLPTNIHVFADRQGAMSWTGRSCLGGASVSFPSSLRVELVLDVARGLDVVVVEDLRVPVEHLSAKRLVYVNDSKTYIMIFHVSTGRSASLKLQSNFSWAMGSSLGSWYGARYSCARASVAVIRFLGSNTSMRSSRSIATTAKVSIFHSGLQRYGCIPVGSAFLNLFLSGCLSRLGSDLTNLKVCTWSMHALSDRTGGGGKHFR